MLTREVRDRLDRSNDWKAAKSSLGKLLHETVNVSRGTYKFSVSGGAQGTYSLLDQDDQTPVKVPSGAVVLYATVVAPVGLVSGGAATIDVQLEGANDLLAAQAYTGLDTGDVVDGVPDWTAANAVLTTAERTLQVSINAADLTAGELKVFVFYVY